MSWDPNGNLALENAGGALTTYSWDGENRLLSVQDAGGVETYTYSSDGLRQKKQTGSGTVYHVLDGQNVLIETDGNLSTQAVYADRPGVWGSKYSLRRSGASRFYLPDHQGDTRQLADSGQAVTEPSPPRRSRLAPRPPARHAAAGTGPPGRRNGTPMKRRLPRLSRLLAAAGPLVLLVGAAGTPPAGGMWQPPVHQEQPGAPGLPTPLVTLKLRSVPVEAALRKLCGQGGTNYLLAIPRAPGVRVTLDVSRVPFDKALQRVLRQCPPSWALAAWASGNIPDTAEPLLPARQQIRFVTPAPPGGSLLPPVRYTVYARKAPLRWLIKGLMMPSGHNYALDPSVTALVDLRFARCTFPDALRRVLRARHEDGRASQVEVHDGVYIFRARPPQ